MAVPSIYKGLIFYYEKKLKEKSEVRKKLSAMRLMVSGSSSLPIKTFHEWREISGHDLLERFGMTETGMVLSNPYVGLRNPGLVGKPMPNVECQLLNLDTMEHIEDKGISGELLVKTPNLFKEYYHNEVAFNESF